MPGEFDDLRLSPFTGWTRAHWAALADRLLLAVRPHASASHARITLPGAPGGYGTDVDGLEGFARTFLAAGFRVAGEHGRDPLNLMEWYAEGLAAGTDPASPERWVRLDEHDQAKVEAASIALVLHLTRPWLWDRLGPRVRERVVEYLAPAIGATYPPINWIWFQIVVEQFLASVGGPFERADIEAGLALTDGFARENGWYADGADRAYDHYVGWALHFYPLIWTEMAAGDPDADARRPGYLRRLERYLHDAVHLVGADGSPLIQGRSLTYRFAAAAQFWLGARSGVATPAPGLLRRAASGIARHFADHGAPDEDGLLTLGWHRAWRPIAQSYSGPGSPYWAAKGFLGLSLPADHPVWTATEEPLPVESRDFHLAVAAPGWLVSGTRGDGMVRVINHGTDHSRPGSRLTDSPLYARLGYSTATSPILAGEHATRPVDQSVVILAADGEPSHRTGFETLVIGRLPSGALVGASRWQAHWVTPDGHAPDHGYGRGGRVRLGPWLHTVSIVRGAWEVRLIQVGDAGDGPGSLRVGGWPLPGTGEVREATATATVSHDTGHSLVAGGAGLELCGLVSAEDASPLASRVLVPWCATTGPARAGTWYHAAVYLGGREPGEPPAVHRNGPATVVGWPDGSTDELEPRFMTRTTGRSGEVR
ncbi:hypothetical protein Sru01_20250 [Sphaerisporangium rufum]|uniref:DUF2264 domain-containing protein n=1 Tax=Sphaerisporangium rufum TaxID=1381558 RepID=A0A919R0D4_9ACTN|nr:DUF2264 domain-containing protein [Sphaerisporangium rufum]GII77043.1 hypothetical protein Sru01_20250 [Sphaerisporangium rufum]